jgi:hypothetical protein
MTAKAKKKKRRAKSFRAMNAREAVKIYSEENAEIHTAVEAMRQAKLVQEAKTRVLLDQLTYSVVEM